MLLASAMFALMGAFVKLSSEHGASLAQVVLLRGLPSVVFLLVWANIHHYSIAPKRWKPHVLRNLAGVSSMWLGFYALSQLPLATATSLSYTAPLFIAVFLMVSDGKSRDWLRMLAVLLGFVGVLAVLRPSIGPQQLAAAGAGLASGALAAIAMLQIRQLGREGEAEWRTVLFFSCAVCLSSGIGLGITGWGETDWQGWLMLLGVGSSGLVGQLAMTRAFGSGAALLTAALQYTTIIFSALTGMALWQDTPDAMAWAGMIGIIAAGLLSAWRTMVESRQAQAKAAAEAAAMAAAASASQGADQALLQDVPAIETEPGAPAARVSSS
ncbi:EamA domain-containing protein [Kerstersia similis]